MSMGSCCVMYFGVTTAAHVRVLDFTALVDKASQQFSETESGKGDRETGRWQRYKRGDLPCVSYPGWCILEWNINPTNH